MTPDEWQRLVAMRGVPDEVFKPDLFAPAPLIAQAQTQIEQSAESRKAEADTSDDGEGWHRSVSFWDS